MQNMEKSTFHLNEYRPYKMRGAHMLKYWWANKPRPHLNLLKHQYTSDSRQWMMLFNMRRI